MLITAPAILVALAVLIGFHEYGHYRVAKACGVKVLRFSLGFGRVIWRRQKGETEFVVSAIPLGGYVRMLDERDTEHGPIAPEERHRAFNNRPLRQRVAIVAAGPLANLSLAVVLLAITAWLGSQEPRALLGTPQAGTLAAESGLRAGDLVQAVSEDGQDWREVKSLIQLQSRIYEAAIEGAALKLQISDEQGRGRRELTLDTSKFAGQAIDDELQRKVTLAPLLPPVIGSVNPDGAAAAAGLRAGDRVLAIDGVSQTDSASAQALVLASASGGQPRAMQWVVDRRGQSVSLELTPRIVEEGGRKLPRIGVGFGGNLQMTEVRYGFIEGLGYGVRRTWELSALTVRTIGRMIVGKASVKNISGPITMAKAAGQAAKVGPVVYIGLLALISVSLGVLNLLPLPMLDGGLLMYYLFEGLSGRPVSEWWQQQLQRVGIVVLLLMMGLALSNDVARQFPH
ncbi:RIP metalloprotease RseP [Burkholderiaceae bacterium UC74_6]